MRIDSKYRATLFLVIIITLIFSGCSSAPRTNREAAEPQEQIEKKESVGFNNDVAPAESNGNANNMDTDIDGYVGRKVIKSAQIDLETKEFDKTVNGIVEKTKFIGGYIEKSHVTGKGINSSGNVLNRRANFILRIPEREFEDFLLDINTLGSVTDSDTEGKDITAQYFDTEAHLKSLTIQEERLLEILKKAEKIEDIIELERELSRLRYDIENLTGTLKKWDNLVGFATLHISVYEVHEITEIKENPRTLGNRMQDGFKDSIKVVINIFKGLFVFIASFLPFTIIIVPLGLLAYYFIKRKNKSKK